MYKIPRVIAEVGCNHKGDMEIAKEFIKIAALFCKVDVVKFQKRNNVELLTPEQYKKPHPNPCNAYGKTYGEHREFLEFTKEQHRELKKYCEEFGVIYSASVWDMTSAKEISDLKPKIIKIPSACNNNYKMIEWTCENFEGEIHISLGMTTRAEEEMLIDIFDRKERIKDLVLYSCTSGYPVPFEDICLMEIERLNKSYKNKVKEIAFSGHHLGIAVDIAAYAMGASTIERHFTLDRTWKGTDHAASLEPDGLRRLVRDLNAVQKALNYKGKEVLEIEEEQRTKLKYRNHV